MAELTPKQRLFVAEYLKDLNATQAAIRAGYSAKTANEQGARLLAHVSVRQAVDLGMATRVNEIKVDANYVLQRLYEMAEADINDIYADDGSLLPVKDWPTVFRKGLVTGVDIEELFEGQGKDRKKIGETKKPRTIDRLAVMQTLGKHIGVNAFQDQVKVTGLDALADRMARIRAGK